jgi:hypothetical protein
VREPILLSVFKNVFEITDDDVEVKLSSIDEVEVFEAVEVLEED